MRRGTRRSIRSGLCTRGGGLLSARAQLLLRAVCAAAGLSLVLGLALGTQAVAGDGVPPEEDQGTILIGVGEVWKFFRGTEAPPEGWREPGFDDASWEEGPTGIGYGDDDDNTVLEDMRCTLAEGDFPEEEGCVEGGYLAFFVRRSFERPEVPEGQRLFLKVSYDDGFVLYVNGVQVRRVNMHDGEVSFDTPAAKTVGDAPAEPDAVIVIPLELLSDGANVLAASVHNANLRSSDASFVPRLIVGDPESSPPPEVGCEERCAARAAEKFQACLAEGLPEEECHARKKATLEECLAAECDVKPPPEPGCEEICAAHASETFQSCLTEGLTEEECHARKKAALAECLAAECDVKPPHEPTCEERCAAHASEAFQGCLNEGLPEEECHARKKAALDACLESNCEGEPPPDTGCEKECVASGDAVYQSCMEAGGNKEDCRRRANAIVALCLERCGVGTPCEDRCAVAAQIILTGCGVAGLGEEECAGLANGILERCVEECPPVLPCGDRCAELAERAIAECAGKEGTEEECLAAGAAVLEECLGHCEGEPVPSCDEQCEGEAAEMLAACLEERKEVAQIDCYAQSQSFLAGCKAELGTICEKEQLALVSAFQPFIRGDTDGDGVVDISDPIQTLGYLFLGTEELTCKDAADANDDGRLDVSDPVTVLGVLFLGMDPLPAPSAERGLDPTSDTLLCAY